jgi:hypothetical protein
MKISDFKTFQMGLYSSSFNIPLTNFKSKPISKPQSIKILNTQHEVEMRHVCSVNVPVIPDYIYE